MTTQWTHPYRELSQDELFEESEARLHDVSEAVDSLGTTLDTPASVVAALRTLRWELRIFRRNVEREQSGPEDWENVVDVEKVGDA